MRIAVAVILATAAFAAAQAQTPSIEDAAPGKPVDVAALVRALKSGGYILFFRHTKTDWGDRTKEARFREAGTLDVENCHTQRNLSDEGREEARRQAELFKRLGFPMGEVRSSRYCRAREHAQAFTPTFVYSEPLTPFRTKEKGQVLRQMLAMPPAAGTNTLMFAHGGILWEATDFDSVESETFVFRPGAPAKLVAAVRIEDWARLERGTGTCCAPRDFWRGTPPAE